MKKNDIDYMEIIEEMRLDDIWDALSDRELMELIDDCDYLWESDELNPLDL